MRRAFPLSLCLLALTGGVGCTAIVDLDFREHSRTDGGSGPPPGTPPGQVALRSPWNGLTTGSVHAPAGAVTNEPLKPLFRWEPASGAARYQVQIDDSCESEPGDFRSCAFPSPEVNRSTPTTSWRPSEPLPVSMSAPVGRRYFWRVRACRDEGGAELCGEWSVPRYLDVGRQHSDLNGDGFADLVMGVPFQDGSATADLGAAVVGHGSREGPDAAYRLRTSYDRSIALFGFSIATGDINGDGFADVAVGAPRQENDLLSGGGRGAVYVYYGSAEQLTRSAALLYDPAGELGVGNLGFSVEVADFDGDGFADVVAGSPDQPIGGSVEQGVVHLYRGSGSGISRTAHQILAGPVSENFTRFGYSIARAGDLDGDGFADLVVSAPGGTPEQPGYAYVYYGRPEGGVDEERRVALTNPENPRGGQFGAMVAGGSDLDADGFADLAVGAIEQGTGGQAYLFHGGSGGVEVSPRQTLQNPWRGAGDSFGRPALLGDIDGDGYADLLVSGMLVDEPEVDEGALAFFLGGSSGVGGTPAGRHDHPEDQARANLGMWMEAIGDYNGDGLDDFAVGAPFQNNPELHSGAVYLYLGDRGGPPMGSSWRLRNIASEAESYFGFF